MENPLLGQPYNTPGRDGRDSARVAELVDSPDRSRLGRSLALPKFKPVEQPMRNINSLLIVAILTLPACAQAISPHLQSDADLNATHFVDSQTGWAVGDNATILHTSDGGQTWVHQTAPTDCSLQGVFFLDEKQGWAVGRVPLPYLQRCRGVVLRTDDGGRTWLKENVDTLPALKKVWFQSPKAGFAIGDGSSLFPSGFFFSSNGGRSWNPVAIQGLAGWTDASFLPDGSGLLLSAQGKIVRCIGNNCLSAKTPLPRHRMRNIAWLNEQQAFAVGERGTVWVSLDGGLKWHDMSVNVAASEMDLATVSCLGDNVWIGGLPGNTILHSPDAGRSWQKQQLGSNIPIRQVRFTNPNHAVAIGALGTIHATHDGGATWATTRGANRKLFALGVFDGMNDIPWMLWADLAGGRNARVRTVVVDQTGDSPLTTGLGTRIHDATVATGGHGGERWRKLDKQRLATTIATWQPDMIVTDFLSAPLVKELVQGSATKIWSVGPSAAANPDDNTSQQSVHANQLALPMGQSLGSLSNKAASFLLKRYEPGPTALSFSSLVGGGRLSSGISVASGNSRNAHDEAAAIRAGGQIVDSRRVAQKQAALRTLLTKATSDNATAAESSAWLAQIENMAAELPQSQAATTLFELAHLQLDDGNPAAALEVLESLTAKYPGEPIAAAAVRDAILWSASAELKLAADQKQITTAPTSAASKSLASKTNTQQDQNNPYQFASATSRQSAGPIRSPRSKSPLMRENLRAPQYSSAPTLSLDELVKVAGTKSNPVRAMANNIASPATRDVDVWNMATWKTRISPMLKSDPQLQFAIEAHRRRTNNPGIRQSAVYQRLARSSPTIGYRKCGSQELQFLEPQRQPLKSLWPCVPAPKPHLDGVLDDATWTQTSPVTMKANGPHEPATQVWIAHGGDFLYLAARCERIIPPGHPTSHERTSRDADMRNTDRLELWLDIDRDYATAWHLTIDENGQAADSILSDKSWNPRWFIANLSSASAETPDVSGTAPAAGGPISSCGSWTIEAAIPMSALTTLNRDAAWSIGIQRIIPGAVRQQWPADFNANALETGGMLLFE